MTANVITAAAIKGGVGKTATLGALALLAAEHRKRVLLVDLDPQCSISTWFKADYARANAFDVIEGQVAASEAIQSTPHNGIDLICGHANLATLDTAAGSGRRMEKALQPLRKKYDVIFIDTTPAMAECLDNALFAATALLIPLTAEGLSLQGFYQVANIALHVRQSKRLKILGLVFTQFNKRIKYQALMADAIREAAEKKLQEPVAILGTIRRGTVIPEAIGQQLNIFKYAPKSNPAEDYRALYKKLKEWI